MHGFHCGAEARVLGEGAEGGAHGRDFDLEVGADGIVECDEDVFLSLRFGHRVSNAARSDREGRATHHPSAGEDQTLRQRSKDIFEHGLVEAEHPLEEDGIARLALGYGGLAERAEGEECRGALALRAEGVGEGGRRDGRVGLTMDDDAVGQGQEGQRERGE